MPGTVHSIRTLAVAWSPSSETLSNVASRPALSRPLRLAVNAASAAFGWSVLPAAPRSSPLLQSPRNESTASSAFGPVRAGTRTSRTIAATTAASASTASSRGARERGTRPEATRPLGCPSDGSESERRLHAAPHTGAARLPHGDDQRDGQRRGGRDVRAGDHRHRVVRDPGDRGDHRGGLLLPLPPHRLPFVALAWAGARVRCRGRV